MRDIELLAESIARDVGHALAANIVRRAVEKICVNSLPKAETVVWLKGQETEHITRALSRIVAHRSELEVFLSIPPINPS